MVMEGVHELTIRLVGGGPYGLRLSGGDSEPLAVAKVCAYVAYTNSTYLDLLTTCCRIQYDVVVGLQQYHNKSKVYKKIYNCTSDAKSRYSDIST